MRNILKLKVPGILLIAIIILLIILPHFLATHWLNIAILALWFVFLCSVWNLVGGLAGQFCFAHPIFVASGAYTSTFLYLNYGVSPWLGIVPGMIIAVLLGIFMTWLNFRYKLPHLSFALVSLGFVYIGYFVIGSVDVMGGHDGLTIIEQSSRPGMFLFTGKIPYYYIIFFMAAGSVALYWILDQAKIGLYLKAIRDNDDAATSIGIYAMKYMIIIMSISAALSAMAGTFYAQYMRFVEPEGIAGPHLVIQMILFTAIGGIGTLWGPVVGAFVLVTVGELLSVELGYKFAGVNLMVYGLIVVIVILYMPTGIVGWFQSRFRSKIET